ncbi:MAG: 16S rRNA (guanine(527)-N(7))-methyltransferase RsmG, partial [Actinomycetota bacterium]|nr:16S rRNA (guanine(527)-N(7))-methyltransferase RsmG [Actinomycetota bacterium]
ATPGGRVLALKGKTAAEEIARDLHAIRRSGGRSATARECGVGLLDTPSTVVEVSRAPRS